MLKWCDMDQHKTRTIVAWVRALVPGFIERRIAMWYLFGLASGVASVLLWQKYVTPYLNAVDVVISGKKD